ncbi:hypothetical protein UNSWDHB_2648 [Dehalobacter sp. UNSWDHB]|nr:hypothetical protein UNSWDHB_2648 [Dehalobacter sp. UNSWDHB]
MSEAAISEYCLTGATSFNGSLTDQKIKVRIKVSRINKGP